MHLAGSLVAASLLLGGPVAALENARTLILAIDSIPLPVVESYVKTRAGGHSVLANLSKPTALISTFPSVSNSAWTGILEPFDVEKPLGYYGKYYDRDQASVTGFTSDWFTSDPPFALAPWQHFFDWRIDALLRKAVAYSRPAHSSTREIRDVLSAFDGSQKNEFFAYIVSTDALAHSSGPESLLEFLHHLDTALMERADELGHLPFKLVLLSDHGLSGGDVLTNVWPAVRETLEDAGFRIRDAMVGSEDVAIIRVGMVSVFELYSANEKKHGIAKLLSQIPGIHLCVTRDTQSVRVFGSRGTGTIRRKQGDLGELLFSYEWRHTDPLSLTPIMDRLGTPAEHASPPWYPDSRWFEATQLSEYPDPLYRLYHSFEIARNSASLLCSLEAGYAFGATELEWLSWLAHGDMQWTHGALSKADSFGFIMTNSPDWRPRQAVRFSEALRFLRQAVEPRSIRRTTSASTR